VKFVSTSSPPPKVSVIVPCHNLGKYLHECVDSVLNQTFRDFEIIVVDDGSTDVETIEALQRLESLDLQIIRTANRGLVSARNLGISKAQGSYICCLDADDTYHPEFLERTAFILDRDSGGGIGIVTTWVNVLGVESRLWETARYDVPELLANNVIHVASLFRKGCWEEVGGYSANLAGYQDWDFWISIVAKGYIWETLEEPLFNYRIRKGSMVSKSNLIRLDLYKTIIENNFTFFKENFYGVLLKIIAIQVDQNRVLEERWVAMQSMEALVRVRDEAIAGQARILEERWAAMQSMEALVRVRDEAIAGQARILEERWAAMQSMEALVRVRDEAIAGQARILEERWAAMQSMETLIRERDEVIIEQRQLLEKRPTTTEAMRALLSAVKASLQHRVSRVLKKNRGIP
jgi:glycosyltransferase involved in cell wall biosynthesis